MTTARSTRSIRRRFDQFLVDTLDAGDHPRGRWSLGTGDPSFRPTFRLAGLRRMVKITRDDSSRVVNPDVEPPEAVSNLSRPDRRSKFARLANRTGKVGAKVSADR